MANTRPQIPKQWALKTSVGDLVTFGYNAEHARRRCINAWNDDAISFPNGLPERISVWMMDPVLRQPAGWQDFDVEDLEQAFRGAFLTKTDGVVLTPPSQ